MNETIGFSVKEMEKKASVESQKLNMKANKMQDGIEYEKERIKSVF